MDESMNHEAEIKGVMIRTYKLLFYTAECTWTKDDTDDAISYSRVAWH